MRKDLRTLCTNYHKPAFTLAEVLITLGIIGVVAAMTLPVLIQNYQKQTYVTGLKKGMSVVSNMLKKMVADEEASNIGATKIFSEGLCSFEASDCEKAGIGNSSIFESIIPNYLNVIKICKKDNCPVRYNYIQWPSDYSQAGMVFSRCYALSLGYDQDITTGVYTSDGMIFYFLPLGGMNNLGIAIDVNGDKAPNTVGRDLFVFGINADGKIIFPSSYNYVERLMSNGWKMDY